MCEYGLQPAQGGQTCVPQTCSVPNCQICLQNKMANNGLQLCLVCQQGYFINSYFQCVSYNPALSAPNCTGIYNCLYCGYNNSCDYCSPGWNPINGVCLTTIGCTVANCAQCSSPSVCYSCATNYQLSTNNVCILTCNINGCTTCATTTTCQTCGPNFCQVQIQLLVIVLLLVDLFLMALLAYAQQDLILCQLHVYPATPLFCLTVLLVLWLILVLHVLVVHLLSPAEIVLAHHRLLSPIVQPPSLVHVQLDSFH